MKNNKYKNWVFTWSNSENIKFPDSDSLERFLSDKTEKFSYQLEIGEEKGVEHYQGCFRTKIRVRHSTILNTFKSFSDVTYLTIDRMQGDWEEAFSYTQKEETAVKGSFRCSPELVVYTGRDIDFLKDKASYFPWQKTLYSKIFEDDAFTIKTPDDRSITWITDRHGNSGKSKFVKFLAFNCSSVIKLPFGTASQLRSSVITAGVHKIYFIDIPRTLGEDDSMKSLISVLEDIKNGFVVSSMYGKHEVLLFNPPHVICFSNTSPDKSLLSQDRWDIYHIDEKRKLYRHENNYSVDADYMAP